MNIKILGEGFVTRREAGTDTAVAAGARCVVTREQDVLCSFMVQRELGVNDFKPMLSRSADGGRTWQEQGLIWPELCDSYSIFGSISIAPDGDLFFFGGRAPIDEPGESNWNEATQGLKQNELIWARSCDSGRTWSAPTRVPMPIPGSAETPGPMWITRQGTWVACYAPYNTFDPDVVVDRGQIVCIRSEDRGRTWTHTSMLRFAESDSGGAEAWVVELSDGRLLGTSWHLNHADGSDYPNAYALSHDQGRTWTPTRSCGIMGQSTSLCPLPDGKALFVYNQRKHGEVGVWMAVVTPADKDFGVQSNELMWQAETRTQSDGAGDHAEWTDFSFGEPCVVVLPDKTLLAVLWCIEPAGRGIRYVRLECF